MLMWQLSTKKPNSKIICKKQVYKFRLKIYDKYLKKVKQQNLKRSKNHKKTRNQTLKRKGNARNELKRLCH